MEATQTPEITIEDSQRIKDLYPVPETKSPRKSDSSSDSEIISNIVKERLDKDETVENKKDMLSSVENLSEKTTTEKTTDSIPENEPKVSLLGRIKDGFIAGVTRIWNVTKYILSTLKSIIVAPYNFVASYFNKESPVSKIALKSQKTTNKFFTQTRKRSIVLCVAGIALIAGIVYHQKIEAAVRNLPKLF